MLVLQQAPAIAVAAQAADATALLVVLSEICTDLDTASFVSLAAVQLLLALHAENDSELASASAAFLFSTASSTTTSPQPAVALVSAQSTLLRFLRARALATTVPLPVLLLEHTHLLARFVLPIVLEMVHSATVEVRGLYLAIGTLQKLAAKALFLLQNGGFDTFPKEFIPSLIEVITIIVNHPAEVC